MRHPRHILAFVVLALCAIYFSGSKEAHAQALQPGAAPNNIFDPTNTINSTLNGRNMPYLYTLYIDPSYTNGANNNQGFKYTVVQQVVGAIQGVTQPVQSTTYQTYGQTYQYVWTFFGMLVFSGLLLSGWKCWQDHVSGRADSSTWIWYAGRIVVAVIMWTSVINSAPNMMISFIDQFTGLSSQSISGRLASVSTNLSDADAYLKAMANGQIPGNLAPYTTAIALAYNTLDKQVVGKAAVAIGSVQGFQAQLGYSPQQAEQWVNDMTELSYQIHIDNTLTNIASPSSVESQYGMDLAQLNTDSNGGTVSDIQVAKDIAAKFNSFSGGNFVPSNTLDGADQVISTFLASQKAASQKFYIQLTNRLRAIANQPMIDPPGVNPNDKTPDNWLGTSSSTDQPSGMPALRYPNDPGNTSGGSNTNIDNSLTAAGLLENAIPQPGEAPPVVRLVREPQLLKNVVNFAMVEIGVSIWSLPILLMVATVMLLLPEYLTGKSYTQHLSSSFLQVLTIIIACILICVFLELGTMNTATNVDTIVELNKSEVNYGGAAMAKLGAQVFGAYDPATLIYSGLILAAMPIAVGLVRGTNALATAAWGALGASGMSGVTAVDAIQSGKLNTIGAEAIRATESLASGLTFGASDHLLEAIGIKPKPPTSPSK